MSDYRNISIRNKRATYDFEILDTYIAGIVLTGTEIKSLRLAKHRSPTAIAIFITASSSYVA